jgi:hypothetical protein
MNRYTRADGPGIQLKVGEQCGDTTKATLLPAEDEQDSDGREQGPEMSRIPESDDLS